MKSLVSVVVVTYNSADFVIETLESVKDQSWNDIELIITDDCSRDETVNLCKSWLEENRNSFVRIDFITSTINTGVSANVNRGLYASRGDWLFFAAGDDTLLSNCIEDNMLWIASNPNITALFSYIDVYDGVFEKEKRIRTIPNNPFHEDSIMAPGRNAESQYMMLLRSDKINFTPSLFINREALLAVGGFDERFKLLEDYPLWLNLTRKGYRLHFMDKLTVNYRMHTNAINNTGLDFIVNPNYFLHEEFRRIYTYPYMPFDLRLSRRFIWYTTQLFRHGLFNRNTKPNRLLHSVLTIYLNPFRAYLYFKKKLNKDLLPHEFYK